MICAETWHTVASVDLRPLDVERVPWWSLTSGGAQLALRGWRFATDETGYSRLITLTNTTTAPLHNYPVMVTIDTAALIAAGKLRADCGDLRFFDELGSLDYWLEAGCNTSTTRIWVDAPYLPIGARSINVTYGNALHTSASSGADTLAISDHWSRADDRRASLDRRYPLPQHHARRRYSVVLHGAAACAGLG